MFSVRTLTPEPTATYAVYPTITEALASITSIEGMRATSMVGVVLDDKGRRKRFELTPSGIPFYFKTYKNLRELLDALPATFMLRNLTVLFTGPNNESCKLRLLAPDYVDQIYPYQDPEP